MFLAHHSLFINAILLWNFQNIVSCFNFEDRDPLVKNSPFKENGSYFGFSIAQHSTKEISENIGDYSILVGAPLGGNLQPGTNHSGALFRCPVDEGYCSQIETDGRREAGGRYIFEDFDYDGEEEESLYPPGSDEIKNGQWLGVTVKSQKPGGIVMVCAHRYIQSPNLGKFHYGQGLCYLLDKDLSIYESLQLCKGRPVEKLHQQFGFCQLGTSVSFVGDQFALMGAPGPYTWRGTVFGQVVVGDFLTKDKTIYHGPFGDIDEIEKYSYLGMSVAGGHFFDKSEYTYISGAPRAEMKGKVYFFTKYNNEEFNISLIITGEQFASSFGYEVLAVDVNNDGYDDLLVGAPFYYGENKGGAVYIYYNMKNCVQENCTWNKVLHGTQQSRFGFSMTSLGDINKDGYNDVAIGAPYDNERGAVYIYLGSQNGLNEEPSQVIRISTLKTFGYSLSGGMDMDNNGYPDLAVGAFESEKVLLFKARPIIDIKIEIKSNELKNINASRKACSVGQSNYTCFSFQCCFSIVGKLKKTDNFHVIYNIAEEKKFINRIWLLDEMHENKHYSARTKTISVSSYSKQYCQKEVAYLKETVSDILSPIKFRVNYTLENNTFHSAILNKTSVKLFEATFQKECGDDDICESYLTLKAGTNLESDGLGNYKVKSINEVFDVEANITNSKDSAYEAKLFVVHPKALSYVSLKSDKNVPGHVKCVFHNETLVSCDIGNPFKEGSKLNLRLKFEIRKDTKDQELKIDMFVNSTSIELSKETSQTINVILRKVAKFQIRGKATSNLFYGGKIMGESSINYLEDIGARVIHKYQIDNNGHWDMFDVKVNIEWPLQVSPGPGEGNRPGKWLLYLESAMVHGIAIDGYCELLGNAKLNELNLNMSKSGIEEPPENLLLPSDFPMSTDAPSRRRKRSLNYVVPYQMTKKNGQNRKVVVLECLNGTAKCIDITCTIKKLSSGNQADIDIRSRIWNSTLVEDYSNVDWVVIRSDASVEIADKRSVSKDSITFFSAETIAYPEIVVADSGLNWIIIGGSVLIGLLLLILLVIILYKCGFFKRKRVTDPTLSGNLQRKDEDESLLK
nr:integrin alpha-PS1 isoform X1 [Leptinotarsa decemlineata]